MVDCESEISRSPKMYDPSSVTMASVRMLKAASKYFEEDKRENFSGGLVSSEDSLRHQSSILQAAVRSALARPSLLLDLLCRKPHLHHFCQVSQNEVIGVGTRLHGCASGQRDCELRRIVLRYPFLLRNSWAILVLRQSYSHRWTEMRKKKRFSSQYYCGRTTPSS